MTIWLALAALSTAQPGSWRAAATDGDRERLREWRAAWVAAVAGATGAGAVAADPALFGPDAGQGGDLPAGDYRCRRWTLGDGGAVAAPWGRCGVVAEGVSSAFTGPAGAATLSGRIWPDGERRSVLLADMAFADERRPPRHGHAAGRDVAGIVERIGPARWRIALPRPPFGGMMQLIELTR